MADLAVAACRSSLEIRRYSGQCWYPGPPGFKFVLERTSVARQDNHTRDIVWSLNLELDAFRTL